MDKLITAAAESGLNGTYFKDTTFTTAVLSRIDSQINFSWGIKSPDVLVPVDNFSIRWKGWLYSPTDTTYTFTLNVSEKDESAVLWIDNNKVIDLNPAGTLNPVVTMQGTVALKAEIMVPVILEYIEQSNSAGLQWFWQSDGVAQSIVDSSYLFPETDIAQLANAIILYFRAAKFINGFSLSAAELAYFINNAPDFANIDFTALKIQHWLRIYAYSLIRKLIPAKSLLAIFQLAGMEAQKNPASPPSNRLVGNIVDSSSWNKQYVGFLIGNAGDSLLLPPVPVTTSYLQLTVKDLKNEIAFLTIMDAMALAKKTNMAISVDGLPGWIQIETMPIAASNFNSLHGIADQIKNAVRSKYKDNWLTIGRQLNDKIRENQKQALIAYMLSMGLQLNGTALVDADALFEYLLIDVQMTSIVVTSRLIQATMAVQLFADRCLLGLENEVAVSAINPDEWDWLKHYPVGAGLKKLFVYVENYLEPSLRDDKSQFFKDFEAGLGKNDITDQNAEDVFRTFLYKLNDAANLDLSGMFNDTDTNTLHVFARTHAAPYSYYYRRRDAYGHWTPWEQLQMDIKSIEDDVNSGIHLMPIVWKKRLFLFWPEFVQKVAQTTASEDAPTYQQGAHSSAGQNKKPNYWETRFGWSEYIGGKWSPKKLSKETFSPFLYQWGSYDDNNNAVIINYPIVGKKVPKLYSIPDIPCHCFSFALAIDYTTQMLKIDIAVGSEYLHSVPKMPAPLPIPLFTVYLPDITSKLLKATDSQTVNAEDTYQRGLIEITNQPSYNERSINGSNYVKSQPFFESYRKDNAKLTLQSADFLLTPTNHKLLFSSALDIQTFENNILYPFFFTDIKSDIVYYVTPADIWFFWQRVVGGLKNANRATLALGNIKNTDNVASQRPSDPGPGETGQASAARGNYMQTNASYAPPASGYQNVSFSKMLPALNKPNTDIRLILAKPADRYVQDTHYEYSAFSGKLAYAMSTTFTGLTFYTFYHPFITLFIKKLNQGGVAALLSADTTSFPADVAFPNIDISPITPASDNGSTFENYKPTLFVQRYDSSDKKRNYYLQNVDFSEFGTYSSYNWELFFHAPFLIATRLSKNGKYAEARKWLHYIFNPLSIEKPYPNSDSTSNFWQVLPFKTTPAENIIDYLMSLQVGYDIDPTNPSNPDNNRQIDEWRADPFNAFLIARNRPIAFMKNVVMAYLDNLIAWGDDLFKTYTRENINEATQLYVIAAHILGPKPQYIPTRGTIQPKSYNDLKNLLDDFGDAVVTLENTFPNSGQIQQNGNPVPQHLLGVGSTLYFCVPPNDKLLQYWTTVGDRLFKIRHGQNIDGVVKPLALYEPPIDPALLLKAHSQGLDISSILGDLESPAPLYRFTYLVQKAKEFAAEVVSLGNAVLAANEKQDAEGLSRLRQTQEIAMLNLVTEIKGRQVLEAQAHLDELFSLRNSAVQRLQHYATDMLGNAAPTLPDFPKLPNDLNQDSSLPAETLVAPATSAIDVSLQGTDETGVKVIPKEKDELDASNTARVWQEVASSGESLAAILSLFPVIGGHITPLGVGVSTSIGGPQIGAATSALARVAQVISSVYTNDAAQAGRMAGFIRREQDWVFQANMAIREIVQIDKQITTAEIRLQMSQHELDNHNTQLQNSLDIEQYLETKFSKQELYQWMVDKLNDVHKQGYELAYEMARKAEKGYCFELGLPQSNFVQYGYYDDSYAGITAGEQLQLALNQMDASYHVNNIREFELSRHISLATLDPAALLQLIESGSCQFQIPEEWFDMDYPGHYFRRIKSVSMSIPCVAGPYTTISSTLRLQQNSIRINSMMLGGGSPYARDTNNADARFVQNNIPFTAIATSMAQNDSGTFELNFRDERYLPFEGAGAISNWQLELNGKFADPADPTTIFDISQFDYSSIQDIIVHIKYTSREDAGDFRQNAITNLLSYRKEINFIRSFSVKKDFPNEFFAFINNPANNGDQVLNLTMASNRFPYFASNGIVKISKVEFVADSVGLTKISLVGSININLVADNDFGSLLHGIADYSSTPLSVTAAKPLTFPITVKTPSPLLTSDSVKDLFILLYYSLD